ncbi:hypothetical protein [Glaciihabitans tibetensis]|uniref:hypothetical protein n=1 Tax=Glaciihabitans tibetensis TaxID=1266600 RepID=UPI0011B218C8|nr:hypothetical protein [Glaciihabitans tibetensis]
MSTSTKKNRRFAKALTAAGMSVAVLGSGLAFGIVPASADPVGDPANRAIVGFGSDTTQDVLNGLSQVVVNDDGIKTIGSWNATGSSTVTLASGKTIPRPNGSSAGVAALRAATTSTAYPAGGTVLAPADIQFARSSSAATFRADGTGTYTYIPFGVDAVSFAKAPTSAVPSDIALGATVGQNSDSDSNEDLTLKNIYNATDGELLEVGTSGVLVKVGRAGTGAAIVPFVPQSGSGTRTFWATTLLGSSTAVFGGAVADSYTLAGASKPVQEHDGQVTVDVTNAMVPFSIAQHIAQGKEAALEASYQIAVADRRRGAVLGTIGGVATTNTNGTLNSAFPIARPVFNVVRTADIAALSSTFVSGPDSVFAAKATPTSTTSTIEDFGFGLLPLTVGGRTYTAGQTDLRVN